MDKTAVVYWSGTGNTQAMAEAIATGMRAAGAQAEVLPVSAITPTDAAAYAKLALGCPSMGDEVLEESEFEPFYEALAAKLSGKKVALFGSYGWGDGQWMRDWAERAQADGASVFGGEGLIMQEAPDEAACEAYGRSFAAY